MAMVITNGTHFVFLSEKGGVKKTEDINQAKKFIYLQNAIHVMKKAPEKTKSYYVFDTFENKIIWRWMSDEERIEYTENKIHIQRNPDGKIKRKKYSKEIRKMLYQKAECRCQLCGRKILLSDATLDHIIPLSMGGEDCVENLQIACAYCNQHKDKCLPEEYEKRIASTFMYQMGKKHTNSIRWKFARVLLYSMK